MLIYIQTNSIYRSVHHRIRRSDETSWHTDRWLYDGPRTAIIYKNDQSLINCWNLSPCVPHSSWSFSYSSSLSSFADSSFFIISSSISSSSFTAPTPSCPSPPPPPHFCQTPSNSYSAPPAVRFAPPSSFSRWEGSKPLVNSTCFAIFLPTSLCSLIPLQIPLFPPSSTQPFPLNVILISSSSNFRLAMARVVILG